MESTIILRVELSFEVNVKFFSVLLLSYHAHGEIGKVVRDLRHFVTLSLLPIVFLLSSSHLYISKILGKISAMALVTVSTPIKFDQLLAFKQNRKKKILVLFKN